MSYAENISDANLSVETDLSGAWSKFAQYSNIASLNFDKAEIKLSGVHHTWHFFSLAWKHTRTNKCMHAYAGTHTHSSMCTQTKFYIL